MFQPTHWLVSRSRRIPVVVVARGDRSAIFTEKELGKVHAPAFELHPKLGIFCRGVQVIGYELAPIQAAIEAPTDMATTAR